MLGVSLSLTNISLFELFIMITLAAIVMYFFAVLISNTYITLSPKTTGIISVFAFISGVIVMSYISGNAKVTLEMTVLLIAVWIWLIYKAVTHTRHRRQAQQQINQMKKGGS